MKISNRLLLVLPYIALTLSCSSGGDNNTTFNAPQMCPRGANGLRSLPRDCCDSNYDLLPSAAESPACQDATTASKPPMLDAMNYASQNVRSADGSLEAAGSLLSGLPNTTTGGAQIAAATAGTMTPIDTAQKADKGAGELKFDSSIKKGSGGDSGSGTLAAKVADFLGLGGAKTEPSPQGSPGASGSAQSGMDATSGLGGYGSAAMGSGTGSGGAGGGKGGSGSTGMSASARNAALGSGFGGAAGLSGAGAGGADSAEMKLGNLGNNDGKNSLPAMVGEDPEDYFTRIGLDESLFKKVSKRYEQKAIIWAKPLP